MKKRTLALVLAVLMLAALMPAGALAVIDDDGYYIGKIDGWELDIEDGDIYVPAGLSIGDIEDILDEDYSEALIYLDVSYEDKENKSSRDGSVSFQGLEVFLGFDTSELSRTALNKVGSKLTVEIDDCWLDPDYDDEFIDYSSNRLDLKIYTSDVEDAIAAAFRRTYAEITVHVIEPEAEISGAKSIPYSANRTVSNKYVASYGAKDGSSLEYEAAQSVVWEVTQKTTDGRTLTSVPGVTLSDTSDSMTTQLTVDFNIVEAGDLTLTAYFMSGTKGKGDVLDTATLTIALTDMPTSEYNPNSPNKFTDVHSSDPFYNAVLWAVDKQITTGTTSTTFEPELEIDRGQVVTFLHRMLFKPYAKPTSTFTDVASDDWYSAAVYWAVANNVTKGTSETTFSPAQMMTRQEIMLFLYRYAIMQDRGAGVADVSSYADAGQLLNDEAATAMGWAIRNGILTPDNGLLEPTKILDRGEVVTYLYRYTFGK